MIYIWVNSRFFDIPVDNLFATPIFARHIKKIKTKNLICVAPDVGGTARARALGKMLNIGLAIVDKEDQLLANQL